MIMARGEITCRRSAGPMEVRYSVVVRGRPVENGSGRTIEMSSSGLSFTANTPLSIGQRLEVSIDWPVPLDGGVRLQIVAWGGVVRSAGAVTAIRIERHNFR